MDKKKILIVDDEQIIRRLIVSLLSNDYTILEASDGGEAINTTKLYKPDLILMDIMMPRVDGYTACHKLKTDEATSTIPIIMLTGVGLELNRKLAEEMGADGYMTKPIRLNDLRAMVSKFLAEPE